MPHNNFSPPGDTPGSRDPGSPARSSADPGGGVELTSPSRVAFELVAASFVVLFQELTLIRWLPVQVRVLAYFPNLILLSAFLGLGLGCLRAGRRSLLYLWPFSILVLVGATLGMSRIAFTHHSPSEFLWLLYFDLGRSAPVIRDVRLPIILSFVLSTASFIPLGQIVAERLQRFRVLLRPLHGYSYDIAGSLLGVAAFAALCFLQTVPVLWFAVFVTVGSVFFAKSRRFLAGYLAVGAIILLGIAGAERADRYSPYYAITAGAEGFVHFTVLTNGSLHQIAFPVARGAALASNWELARKGYHLPYGLLQESAKRVLVLGAGTGNDVAVALDEAVEHIDAVEIDPVIFELGRDFHPNRPYASPRVRAKVTDARSFLNDSREQYDLIVFGTLDSMTRLSALSNVRLDSFVYTLDSLRAARARLSPTGGIVMYFMVNEDYIDSRLIGMLTETFDEPPIVLKDPSFLLFNRIYMAGPAFTSGPAGREMARIHRADGSKDSVEMPSDDWPYLYLRARGISSFYLSLMTVFTLLAILGVSLASREMRKSLAWRGGFDGEMFFFGLAFLLLETKAVTQTNLLWGATWLTSAVIFGSILAMVLFATILMQVHPISWRTAFTGLVLSLAISYVIPTHAALGYGVIGKLGFSLLFVGLPIFFASACFAGVFATREKADLAFGWNLLGAVAGGLLEFLSMVIGLRALALTALAAYLVAALLRRYQARSSAVLHTEPA